MACFSPIKGYRAPGGQVVFNPKMGWIDLPVVVSCGQCKGCRLERSRQWAVRIMHEAQMHEQNCFLTLTYDDEHLPEGQSLEVRDFQLFMKKLRKKMGPVRFYHCGEYGDQYGRPHYHACLFGVDFSEDRVVESEVRGNKNYSSPRLDELWPGGHAVLGTLTFESAAYVARYIMKKQTGERAEEHYRWIDGEGNVWDRKPEYTTMSRRPGIGKEWLHKYGSDVYPSDFVVVNGKRARPPKFYDSQFELEDPLGMERIKSRRKAQGSRHKEDQTVDRLRVKEEVQEAKMKVFKREVE